MTDGLFDAASQAEDRLESNAAATALALDGARDRPELSGVIADFLREQKNLIAEQREQLRDQDKRTRLGIVDQRFSIALKAMTALVGLALAAGLALAIWNDVGSGGLVIEPFSVPPDLVARGITGEVVASHVLDRLAEMQLQTHSQRAVQSYANYWGDDIKVQIPDTGVSLGELDRFLREKLGHPTHVTGEVVEQQSVIGLTARAGGSGSATVTGPDADFDKLIQRISESVYGLTQPYLYGVWLSEVGRDAEAKAEFMQLAQHGSPAERGWGYLGWSNTVELTDGEFARLALLKTATGYAPDLFLPRQNIVLIENAISSPEETIRDSRIAMAILSSPDHGGISGDIAPLSLKRLQGIAAVNLGAFHDASPLLASVNDSQFYTTIFSTTALLERAEVGEHDLAAARAALGNGKRQLAWINSDVALLDNDWARMLIDTEARNWRGVLEDERTMGPLLAKDPGLRSLAFAHETPWVAYAEAQLGNFDRADTAIAETPGDCYVCLLMRARIRALEGKRQQAGWWFARIDSWQPSIPFADADWGEMLLANSDLDGAITKFKTANQKGPHFADPPEMWGEALILKNRSDLALEKFAEATKNAPNWGRLHLKWGEALAYLGQTGDAKTQFAVAAGLDLSPADRTTLEKWMAGK
jgi:tetratricopeptide (TPR) repeat protein